MHNYPLQLTATTFRLLQQAVKYGLGDEGETALLKLWTISNSSKDSLQVTEYGPISLSEEFASLPKFAHSTEDLLEKIQDHLHAKQNSKLVVLDDNKSEEGN